MEFTAVEAHGEAVSRKIAVCGINAVVGCIYEISAGIADYRRALKSLIAVCNGQIDIRVISAALTEDQVVIRMNAVIAGRKVERSARDCQAVV